MLDSPHLGPPRKHMSKVPLPRCRVGAITQAGHASPSSMASMRPRTREPVSVLSLHNDSSTCRTSVVSITLTGKTPITG